MSISHSNKYSGENGLYVGAKGSEVQVSDSSGNLSHGGTAITSSAAELNILSGVTATAAEINELDLSTVGAVQKVKKIGITAPDDDSETKTGFILPDNAVVTDVFVNVTTAEATGTTKTINVGTDATDGGDPDGYLVGVDVSNTGLVKGTLLSSGQTLGALLSVDEGGTGELVKEIDIASGGKEITFTAASADFDELVADIFIVYIEVA